MNNIAIFHCAPMRSLAFTVALLGLVATALFAQPGLGYGNGSNGAFGPTALNTVVNSYAPVTGVGGTIINIGAATGVFSPPCKGLVIQMTGANAGLSEWVDIVSVTGTTASISAALTNTYTLADKVQIISVPQYTTVSISGNNHLSCLPWNGSVGGVLAFWAQGMFEAFSPNAIDVSGRGFLGGTGGAMANGGAGGVGGTAGMNGALTGIGGHGRDGGGDGAARGGNGAINTANNSFGFAVPGGGAMAQNASNTTAIPAHLIMGAGGYGGNSGASGSGAGGGGGGANGVLSGDAGTNGGNGGNAGAGGNGGAGGGIVFAKINTLNAQENTVNIGGSNASFATNATAGGNGGNGGLGGGLTCELIGGGGGGGNGADGGNGGNGGNGGAGGACYFIYSSSIGVLSNIFLVNGGGLAGAGSTGAGGGLAGINAGEKAHTQAVCLDNCDLTNVLAAIDASTASGIPTNPLTPGSVFFYSNTAQNTYLEVSATTTFLCGVLTYYSTTIRGTINGVAVSSTFVGRSNNLLAALANIAALSSTATYTPTGLNFGADTWGSVCGFNCIDCPLLLVLNAIDACTQTGVPAPPIYTGAIRYFSNPATGTYFELIPLNIVACIGNPPITTYRLVGRMDNIDTVTIKLRLSSTAGSPENALLDLFSPSTTSTVYSNTRITSPNGVWYNGCFNSLSCPIELLASNGAAGVNGIAGNDGGPGVYGENTESGGGGGGGDPCNGDPCCLDPASCDPCQGDPCCIDPASCDVLCQSPGSNTLIAVQTGTNTVSFSNTTTPYDPAGCQGINLRADYDNDGFYDDTNLFSVFTHTFPGAGTYTVLINVSCAGPQGGCSTDEYITVVIPNTNPCNTAVNAAITNSGASCESGSGVTLTATASGTTATYSYLWSRNLGNNPSGTIAATAANSGIYTVTITATNNGCTATAIATTNVVIHTNPIATISGNLTIGCNAATNTTTLSATTGNYAYNWSGASIVAGQGTAAIQLNAAGVYRVTITNSATGCSATTSVLVVINNTPIAVSISGATSPCSNSSTMLTATTAAAGTSFLWSDNVTRTATYNTAVTGTYCVTATSANGCATASSCSAVTVRPAPAVAITLLCCPASLCTGQSATMRATGASSYLWSANANNATSAFVAVTPAPIAPANTTTYCVVGTASNGCTASACQTFTSLPVPTVTITGPTSICGNAASLTASGGGSYVWSTFQPNGTTPITTATTPVMASGTYTVTVTNAARCMATASYHINMFTSPTVTLSGSNIACDNGSVGLNSSVQNGTAPFTYSWSSTNPNSSTTTTDPALFTNASLAGSTLSNPSTGVTTYCITVTDVNGCSGVTCKAVTIHSLPTVSITGNTAFCQGGTITLTASSPTVTATTPNGGFEWNNTAYSTTASLNVNAINTNNLPTGDYCVTAKDLNSCKATACTTLIINPAPEALLFRVCDDYLCDGETNYLIADATPIAGYTWTEMDFAWSATEHGTLYGVTQAGTYCVTVTNPLTTCSASACETVHFSPTPQVSISGTLVACGTTGSTTLTASGGDAYIWLNDSQAEIGYAPTITVGVGVYTVIATNAGNSLCNASTFAVVVDGSLAPLTITATNINCNGDQTTLQVLGCSNCSSYAWSSSCDNANTPPYLHSDIISAGLGANLSCIYTVTATNVFGCIASTTATVTQPAPLVTVLVTNSLSVCEGSQGQIRANATGGTAGYIYDWGIYGIGIDPKLNLVFTANEPTYTVTVTDTHGCTTTASITMTVNLPPTVSISGASGFCPNQSLNLEASSPTATIFNWNSAPNTNDPRTTVSAAGTYTVTATDPNGCSASTDTRIAAFPSPPVSISGDLGFCPNKIAQLQALAPTAITHNWNAPPPNNVPLIRVNLAGIYTVTVQDGNGCTATASQTVTAYPAPTVTISGVLGYCPNMTTRLDALSMTAISYMWTNIAPPANILASVNIGSANTYTVEVANSFGCLSTASAVVAALPVPTVSITGNLGYCPGRSTTITAASPTAINYRWSTVPATFLPSITVSTASIYTVTVGNASLCTATASAQITQLPAPTISLTGAGGFCPNRSTSITAIGAITPASNLTYTWINSGTATATFNTAGTYTVTVTAINTTCSTVSATTIVAYTAPSLSISGIRGFCPATATTLSATAPTAVNYTWTSPLPPTASATITAAGTYTVTVADANTCTATGSATVVPFASPTAAITGNTTFCTGSSTTLTASGGTAYTWNTTPVRYTAGVLITAGGTYTVTVTNANGCTATQSVTVTVNTNCCNLSITDIVYTINSNNRQVQFQTPVLANGSSGTLTYNWTFGDPAVPNSTNAAPFVVYPTAGLKTVCLTVRLTKTDGTICATQCCRTIAIGDTTNMLTNFSPQFAFIAPSISPTNTYQFNGQINPSTVVSTYRLYNSTTTGTQGTLLATYVGNSFSYTFPTGGGEYIVSREISAVSNANTLMGNYNTLVESRHVTVLSVNGCNATAGFTATFTSNASRTVAFANAGTASSNGYIWEFATTLTGVYSPIAGTAASQSFTFPGTTTTIWVRLTINKGLACESSMTHRVEMTTAAITSSNTNFRISTMQFTTNSTTRQLICAAPTVISTSAVTNTVWAAPAGSATATGSASAPTFTFVNPGLYTVTVTVVFANGFKSVAARTVNIPTGTPAISASAPFLHASFSYYADHTIGSSAYNFANSATTYPANYTHLWELFNGFATTGTPILTGTNSSIGYAPTVAGDFSVCHTISVADNTTFGAARRVRTCRHETGIASTNGCGAVPRYTARLSSAASTTAIFTGTSTNANTSVWEYATTATGVYSLLGSAANAALASPTFNFGGTGTYWVRLTINKGTGCEASVTHRIELNTNSCQAAALLVAQAMPNGQTQRSLLLTPITSLNEVVLYPNPTSGSFTLSFGESLREEADIQLIDMRGTQLAQTHIEAGSTDTTLDLTDFATGVYLVQIRTASGEKIVRKVVKQ